MVSLRGRKRGGRERMKGVVKELGEWEYIGLRGVYRNRRERERERRETR
jgi:hypothetical protein